MSIIRQCFVVNCHWWTRACYSSPIIFPNRLPACLTKNCRLQYSARRPCHQQQQHPSFGANQFDATRSHTYAANQPTLPYPIILRHRRHIPSRIFTHTDKSAAARLRHSRIWLGNHRRERATWGGNQPSSHCIATQWDLLGRVSTG